MSSTTQQLITAVLLGGLTVAIMIWLFAVASVRKQERQAAILAAAKLEEGSDSGAVAPPAFAQARGHSQRHVEVPDGFDYVPD